MPGLLYSGDLTPLVFNPVDYAVPVWFPHLLFRVLDDYVSRLLAFHGHAVGVQFFLAACCGSIPLPTYLS